MPLGNMCLNVTPEKEVASVKDIVEAILTAKKQTRIYPANNPLHINASVALFEKFKTFFEVHRSISFKVTMHALLYKNEPVYDKAAKEDNLAFFFFKDGIREITFLQGIEQSELLEFINILNINFETDAPDDDIVTILWDRDFKKIKYFVDHDFLGSPEVPQEDVISDDKVRLAYEDALKKEVQHMGVQIKVTESDLTYVSDEIEKQNKSKLQKVTAILCESLNLAEEPLYIKEIIAIIKDMLNYCVQESDYSGAASIMATLKRMFAHGSYGEEVISSVQNVHNEINSKNFIAQMEKPLKNISDVNREDFFAFAGYMDKRAVMSFIHLLGKLDTIKGKHLIMDTLVLIGQKNLDAIIKGLDDSRWYVVRNIALVLGKIGNPDAAGSLTRTLSHPEYKVRKEAVIAIGNMRSAHMLRHLEHTLNDDNKAVRIATVRTLGNINTEDAKKLVLAAISGKSFTVKEFSEKKEFFRIIARWDDSQVREFLGRTLNKKTFFNTAKNDEKRACAAYALGIMKDKSSIKPLEKASRSSNKVLREYAAAALKQLIF